MRIAILGGLGLQGRVAIHYLASKNIVSEVLCADLDAANTGHAKLADLAKTINIKKVKMVNLDVTSYDELVYFLKQKIDVAVDLLPAKLMPQAFRVSIDTGVPLVSTNYRHSVQHFDKQAKKAGVQIMPECGFDPGIDLVLLGHGASRFDTLEAFDSYGGAIPTKDACDNVLNYKISWSWEGVLSTQLRESIFIHEGERQIITGDKQHENPFIHEIDFPGLGALEAYPNGDAALFAEILNVVDNIRRATRYSLRWPGWCDLWRILKKLGFLSNQVIDGLGLNITPFEFMVRFLEPKLQYSRDEKDLAILYVVMEGIMEGRRRRIAYSLLAERDLESGIFALHKMVSYPACAVAIMMAKGEIKGNGLLSPIKDIPFELFMKAMSESNIQVREEIEDLS
jgi:saccharopine dehydrogenase-like NADP-dependent oxidoreductase